MSELEARLLGVLVGLVVTAIGLVLATNFRGFTTWHARTTIEIMKGADNAARRVPPWSWLADTPLEQRVARQAGLSRVIGVVFTAAGILVVFVCIFGHFAKAS